MSSRNVLSDSVLHSLLCSLLNWSTNLSSSAIKAKASTSVKALTVLVEDMMFITINTNTSNRNHGASAHQTVITGLGKGLMNLSPKLCHNGHQRFSHNRIKAEEFFIRTKG